MNMFIKGGVFSRHDTAIGAAIRKRTGSDCRESVFGHDWEVHKYDLNGHFWHHGALGRAGELCRHCSKVRFFDTDQEHYDNLPKWLKTSPHLIVPKGVVRIPVDENQAW